MGHKRLALEAGEDPVHNTMDYYLDSINTIYSIKHKNGAIRRVNINIAATTVDNYRLLKEAGSAPTSSSRRPTTKRAIWSFTPQVQNTTTTTTPQLWTGLWRAGSTMWASAFSSAWTSTGMSSSGSSCTRSTWRPAFGVGPHTISVPRLRDADDIDSSSFKNGIDDDTFAKLVACIRIAVPYTGMIISTRESKACRRESSTWEFPRSAAAPAPAWAATASRSRKDARSEQFDVIDSRTLDEVVRWLMEMDYIPSFCTACYREGRTGDRFMSLCKSGQIQNCCHPNALMTLEEYLMDYASPETKAIGDRLIDREIQNVPNPKARAVVEENLRLIRENNRRDFRF